MHSLQTLFSGPPGGSVSYFIVSNEASKEAPGGYAPLIQGGKPGKKTEKGRIRECNTVEKERESLGLW